MYIYAANLQMKPGSGVAAGDHVARIRDAVAAATGRPAVAWAASAGAPIGAFTISSRVDNLDQLVDSQMKMAADAGYQQVAAEARDLLATPVETRLARVVATRGEVGEPSPVTQVTMATIAVGHMKDAMAWADEVLDFVTSVTGAGGSLVASAAGNTFEIGWIIGFDSAAAADSGAAALYADEGYVAHIDRSAGMFVSGTTNRTIMIQLP